jgi:DNA-binding protein HU-beta
MNRTDLINLTAEQNGFTKVVAEKVVNNLLDTIVGTVAKGEKVELRGFGTFGSAHQEERPGFNPVTGERITIAAATRPSFKFGQAFKDAVNGKITVAVPAAHKPATEAGETPVEADE